MAPEEPNVYRIPGAKSSFAPAEQNVWCELIHLPEHCAPLERQTGVGREVYKHMAPLEPEYPLVAALLTTGWRDA